MDQVPDPNSNAGLLLYVGSGALVALVGVVLAWLKWRKPPADK